MSLSADAAVLNWVNDGNPMSDSEDENDDLDSFYVGEAGDLPIPNPDTVVEDSNGDVDVDFDINDLDVEEEVIISKKNYPRRILTANRLVNSIDSCL